MRNLGVSIFLFGVFLGSGSAYSAERVLILGDSLTEGYGVSKDDSFPSVLEAELRKEGHPKVRIINAGIGGSTSASGLSRLKWSLKGKPEILVLALGGNDGLRGLKPEETKKNLAAVVALAKQNGLQVILAGMMAPPNYGAEYTRKFERTFQELAREQKVKLIPFLLDGVAGETALNQPDGIHPNEKGHQKIARTVKRYLLPLL